MHVQHWPLRFPQAGGAWRRFWFRIRTFRRRTEARLKGGHRRKPTDKRHRRGQLNGMPTPSADVIVGKANAAQNNLIMHLSFYLQVCAVWDLRILRSKPRLNSSLHRKFHCRNVLVPLYTGEGSSGQAAQGRQCRLPL